MNIIFQYICEHNNMTYNIELEAKLLNLIFALVVFYS